MELNKYLNIINSYEPLFDWVTKNQYDLLYYNPETRKFDFKKKNTSKDLEVLSRLSHAFFTWLETDINFPDVIKAKHAANTIKGIYDAEKDLLSDEAKEKYYISVLEYEEKLNNKGR